MRIILYTGKGGVGKTSVAAATALRCAELGHRTLVMSTDIAHSLGDVFAVPLGPEPVAVAGNLWGQEVDVEEEVDVYWGTIQQWLRTLLSWRGVDTILAEDMIIAVHPGIYYETFGIFLGETYHITANGPVAFSSYSRELIEV